MRKIEQKYFVHGGMAGLHVGEYLLPPCVTNAPTENPHSRVDRVYLTTDLNFAVLMARGWRDAAVYRVEPIGRLTPDRTPRWSVAGDRFRRPWGGLHYHAPKALILATAPLPAVRRDHGYFLRAHFNIFGQLALNEELSISKMFEEADEADLFNKKPTPLERLNNFLADNRESCVDAVMYALASPDEAMLPERFTEIIDELRDLIDRADLDEVSKLWDALRVRYLSRARRHPRKGD